MNPDTQFLCSHLVTVRCNGRESTANLERIWSDGATLNAEEPIACGTEITLVDIGVTAIVTFCEDDTEGHFIDLKFPPDYYWTPERFLPQHLTDPTQIG